MAPRVSMLRNARLRSWLLSALAAAAIGSFVAACTHPQPDAPYDIVIEGGRVIDPETGLDAVRNVGIRSGTIARIAGRPLTGDVTIDAHGLVVAPGFIDMHSHALTTPSMRQQAMDGVTTTLELELGSLPVGEAYALLERQGRPINYGFSVSWALARMQVMDGLAADGSTATYQRNVGKPGWRTAADGAQTEQILDLIGQGLDEGGLGIGVMLGYAPATSADEYVAVNRLAAGRGVVEAHRAVVAGGHEVGMPAGELARYVREGVVPVAAEVALDGGVVRHGAVLLVGAGDDAVNPRLACRQPGQARRNPLAKQVFHLFPRV